MTTLLLLPGMDGTGALFQPLLRELPSHWRCQVVAYPMDATLGYDALTRLAEACVPADGPVVVLGESFSGPVAIRLAARLGPRLQALVLCCTFACNPRPALSVLKGALGWLPPPSLLPSAVSAQLLLGPGAAAEVRALLADVLARLPAAVLRARLRMVMAVDVRRELAAVQAPVLYLQARQDRVVPANALACIESVQPAVRVVRLAGPHGLLQASPGPAARAIAGFLAGPNPG